MLLICFPKWKVLQHWVQYLSDERKTQATHSQERRSLYFREAKKGVIGGRGHISTMMTGNTNLEPQLRKMLPIQKKTPFFSLGDLRLVLQKLYSVVAIRFWIELVKNLWKSIFLSCYMCTYIISLILPLNPQILKYLLSDPLQKQLADPWLIVIIYHQCMSGTVCALFLWSSQQPEEDVIPIF